MPVYTSDALILRTYKLGESDRIVVFLTRDRGKKRGVAKNARQSRRRFGGALEPMTVGRVGYKERERRDLVHLEYVEAKRSPMAGCGCRTRTSSPAATGARAPSSGLESATEIAWRISRQIRTCIWNPFMLSRR